MYPTNIQMENQVNKSVEDGLQEITKILVQQHENLKKELQKDMTSLIDTGIQSAVAAIHRHTTSNDLSNINSTIEVNMKNVTTHLTEHDNAISQIRKNIAEHIESLVDKLHDQYMNPENPFANPDDHTETTSQMGAQSQTPRQQPYAGQSPSHTPRPSSLNDNRMRMNDTIV